MESGHRDGGQPGQVRKGAEPRPWPGVSVGDAAFRPSPHRREMSGPSGGLGTSRTWPRHVRNALPHLAGRWLPPSWGRRQGPRRRERGQRERSGVPGPERGVRGCGGHARRAPRLWLRDRGPQTGGLERQKGASSRLRGPEGRLLLRPLSAAGARPPPCPPPCPRVVVPPGVCGS